MKVGGRDIGEIMAGGEDLAGAGQHDPGRRRAADLVERLLQLAQVGPVRARCGAPGGSS